MSNEELGISNIFLGTAGTEGTEETTTKSGITFLISNEELGMSNNFLGTAGTIETEETTTKLEYRPFNE